MAMFNGFFYVYQRVYPISIPLNHYKIRLNHYKIPLNHYFSGRVSPQKIPEKNHRVAASCDVLEPGAAQASMTWAPLGGIQGDGGKGGGLLLEDQGAFVEHLHLEFWKGY